MNEQRLQAYVTLIDQLLSCDNGEELALLQRHAELVDAGLLTVMTKIADLLEQQGKPNAAWLRQFAQQLAAGLAGENQGAPSAEPSMQVSLAFLAEALQRVAGSQGDARQVYPFLKEHQHQLNDTLLQAMPIVASDCFNEDTNQPASVAAMFVAFGNLVAQFPLGKRGVNLELAVTAYQLALQVYTHEAFPEAWAATQNNLAIAYCDRLRGDRADNLEQAITAEKGVMSCFLPFFTQRRERGQVLLFAFLHTAATQEQAGKQERSQERTKRGQARMALTFHITC